MPIEIRELHIRVTVSEGKKQGSARPAAPPAKDARADKDELVAECVEQVLEVLQAKKER